jgi:hypothetical protein
LADGKLSTQDVKKSIPYIFSLVSNLQTSAGDGIDASTCQDNQVVDTVAYLKEGNSDKLCAAVLNSILKD